MVVIKSCLYEIVSIQRGLGSEAARQSKIHLSCSCDICLGVLPVVG